jgi:hypothetical protein
VSVPFGVATISYSDVRNGWPGTGNFALDPLLWGPITGDFHLKPGSPCIDAGDPSAHLDPDGTRADVGAFEFNGSYCGTPGIYCLPLVNSLGCTPSIDFLGSPSFSAPVPFTVTAANEINQKTGFLIWSRVAAPTPWQSGTICLGGLIHRTPVQLSGGNPSPPSDCSGSYVFQFSSAYMLSQGIFAGDTLYAQYYGRDPLHPDGMGRSLSDALEFTFCP